MTVRPKWTRQDFAIAREYERRNARDCIERGHSVHWVGPYRICRTLSCSVLVVESR